MQLWTIQPFAFWEALRRDKVLRARREHVVQSPWDEHNLPPYHWLRERMTERVGPPSEPDIYPIWAYFQFWDVRQRRPDLRRIRSWFPRGQHGVLLELCVDASRVLLCDMGDWYYVLSDYYFPLSSADAEAFESAEHGEELARQLQSESWERIFDLDFYTIEPEISSPREEKVIQATFWELRLEDVVGVREFSGSGNPAKF